MAKDKTININSRLATDELKKDVETAVTELNKVKDAAEGKDPKTGKDINDTKKKWTSFSELFSGALPRDIQMTIRKFKAKTREVKRATTGMDKLNKAMKGFGGPILAAVILGLEKLIEYLPKIIDYFTGNTDAVKALTAANEAMSDSLERFNQDNAAFLGIMMDTTQTLEARQAAQERLARSISGLRDIDLEAADAAEQLQKAYDMEATRQATEVQLKALGDEYTTYTKKREELEERIASMDMERVARDYRDKSFYDKYMNDLMELDEEYAELVTTRTSLAEQLVSQQSEMNRQMEEQQALEEQRNRQFKLNATLAKMEEEMRYDRMDQYDREIAKIDAKQREELQAAHTAGATQEQMTTITAFYTQKRIDIREKEADAQRQEAERMAEEDARQVERMERLRTTMAELSMSAEERSIAQANQRYNEMVEEANELGVATAELEVQRQVELERIRNEFAQKRIDEAKKIADAERKIEDDKLRMLMELYEGNEAKMAELRLLELEREEKRALEEAHRLGISESQVRQFYAKQREELELTNDEEIYEAREKSMKQFEGGMRDLYDGIAKLMDRNSKAARRMAVIEVLVNQAQALAQGIKAAVELTPKTPAYPIQLAGYIAAIGGTILSGFAQVKSILNDAGSNNAGRMETRMPTQALVPSVSAEAMQPQAVNVSAYVVQSDLQGQNQAWQNMGRRITL
jgi:hypothetical protein